MSSPSVTKHKRPQSDKQKRRPLSLASEPDQQQSVEGSLNSISSSERAASPSNPIAIPPRSPPSRELSAEEILQASINFKTSHGNTSWRSRRFKNNFDNDRMLYPTMDQFPSFPLASAFEEKQEEKEEEEEESPVVMARAATVPTSAAAVYVETDDPVMRKIMEEERLMNHARMESMIARSYSSSGYVAYATAIDDTGLVAEATLEGTDLDSKPAAQVSDASEMTNQANLPVDREVHAELIGETEFSASAIAIPFPVTSAPVSEDDYLTEEATVLDSKPAEIPPGWTNEESAEAQVLDAGPQHQVEWTTQQHVTIYEEISVTGRDEAEATVLDINEEIHPADLEDSGVEAELIGGDYTHHESLMSHQSSHQHEPNDVSTISNVIAVTDYDCEDLTSSDARAAFVDPADAQLSVQDVVAQADYVTAHRQEEYNDESEGDVHATIVTISEDIHPADLELSGVQAEFVGQHVHHRDQGSFGDTSNMTRGEAQATMVDVIGDFDFHTSSGGSARIRAEFVVEERNRTASLPELQALPLVSPPTRRSPRAFSEPASGKLSSHFKDDPNDRLGASDAWDSNEWIQRQTEGGPPTKVIPPPEIPAREPVGRDQSCTSNVSGLTNSSSTIEGAGQTQSVSSQGTGERLTQAQRATQAMLSNVARSGTNVMRTTNTVMERLFGTEGGRSGNEMDLSNFASHILPRTLLPWSVFASETTGMWVATVNTNQKALDSNNITEASKALRAFSVPTREQAEALARAWAPPRMLPFGDNHHCFICDAKFGVFKRPCHCRNCGVCICSNCAVQWPSKMIPDTYNIKKESLVNICKSCDWLCSAFRMALLSGSHDQAVAVHATGNVNLVTPFANVKGELFYPVHCAVLGGSLPLLQWLVDTHCCPLRSIRISGKNQKSSGSFTPILTSRGRSLLGIAMENENVDLLRYLVVDKGMPLTGEKDLRIGVLIKMLDRVLRVLPPPQERVFNHFSGSSTEFEQLYVGSAPSESLRSSQNEESWRADEALAYELAQQERREHQSEGSVDDACIICFANSIDCVVTPCGHQICCMQCSRNISRCPVCGIDCSFIKVFRAN